MERPDPSAKTFSRKEVDKDRSGFSLLSNLVQKWDGYHLEWAVESD